MVKIKKLWKDKDHIAMDDYQKILPSNKAIEVFRYKNRFFLNEGNGRVKAIKSVFPPQTRIEVIIKDFPDSTIQPNLERIIDKFYNQWDGCNY